MGRLAAIVELARLLARGRRLWLLPLVGVLLVTAVLLAIVQVVEYVAPFVYTVF